MAAFAESFRSEITRLARKEFKGELEAIRKGLASQRTEMVALKRALKEATTEIRQLQRASASASKRVVDAPAAPAGKPRKNTGVEANFGPAAFKACRIEIGMTQRQMATLVNASLASLVRWENGTKPRGPALQRIADVMSMGKAKAWSELEKLEAA